MARVIRHAVLAVVAATALVVVTQSLPGKAPMAPPPPIDRAGLTFPRTGTYFLDQHNLPTAAELARYDLVVIDSEWANRRPRSFFTDVRRHNPRVRMLAYVNVVDSMNRVGSPDYWANSYRLWQFHDGPVRHSTFPKSWLAHTAAGEPVHEWQDRVMANLTDVAPRVNGLRFVEYAADWVVERVWGSGVWDGVFLDVWGDRIYTADHERWDIDGDGNDEAGDEIYGPGGALDRGLTIGEQRMRAKMPGAVLVANGDRTPRDRLLDGQVKEGFADLLVDPERVLDVEVDRYVAVSTAPGHRQPGVDMTIDQRRTVPSGSSEDRRRARFFLTATLLQNGYWVPMGKDYGELAYYPEMDGNSRGRGYLGHALHPNPTLADLARPAPGVYRRDFEHGIVLVNTSAEARDVRLDRQYLDLDRNPRDTVAVGAGDGVILMRG